MSKKSLVILFLSLACFLQLGHSLFPHSHVKEHHHHGKHHHHDDHSDDNGLSLFFSHFNHNSDTFSNNHLEEVAKIIKEIPDQIVTFDTHLSYANSIGFCNKKELVQNKEPLIFISPHLHSFQFRGPPTTLS